MKKNRILVKRHVMITSLIPRNTIKKQDSSYKSRNDNQSDFRLF